MSSPELDNQPTAQSIGAVEKNGGKMSRSRTVIEALKLIPILGDAISWIYDHFGLAHLLFFIAGLILVIITVSSGLAPDFIISEKYKNPSQIGVQRTKPNNIVLSPVTAPESELLLRYVNWFEDAGDEKKRENPLLHFGVGVVESRELGPTTKFTWILRPNPGFNINGRAFIIRSDGFMKPLNTAIPDKEQGSLLFDIPECNRGDKLVAVVSATWREKLPLVEIQSTFSSAVK